MNWTDLIIILVTCGFSLSEIHNMTISQISMYTNSYNKHIKMDLKNNIYTSLLGNRGSKEDIDKALNY